MVKAIDSLTGEVEPTASSTRGGVVASGSELSIVLLASIGHALCHIAELMFTGVLLAVQQEFSLSKRLVTAVPLLGWVLMGVGAVPAGMLTDRFSPRTVLLVYFLSVAIAATICAVAPTPLLLVVGLTLLGAAVSLYHPAGLALLSLGCKRKGQAMGIHGVAGSLGITVAPAIGLAMAKVASWRWAYGLVAVLGAFSVAYMWLTGAGAGVHGRDVASEGRQQLPTGGGSAREILWKLRFAFAAFLLGGLCYRAFTTALTPLLESSMQQSDLPTFLKVWGPVVLAMVPLGLGSVGQFFGGRWADRTAPEKLYIFLIACAVPCAFAVAMAPGLWLAVVAASVLGLVQFAEQPVENTIIAHVTPADRRSTFYSVKFILGFGVGALGAQAVGEIWERTGQFRAAFLFVGVLALLMLACAVAFARVIRGETRRARNGHAGDV